MNKYLVSEELLSKVLDRDCKAIKKLEDMICSNLIISKKIVEDAYENYSDFRDIESARIIYDIFGISGYDFIKYLYELYEENEKMFFIMYSNDRKSVVDRILRRYRYVRNFYSSSEVKLKIKFNIDDKFDEIIEKYINDEYYHKNIIDVILKILEEADRFNLGYKVIEDFIELKPFTKDSFFIFKYFGKLDDWVIKLYFNENKLFNNIFDIAAYLVKVTPSWGECELDTVHVSKLPLEESIIMLLEKGNNIFTLEELDRVFKYDRIMSLEGMDVESARTIINALGKFYLDCNF